MAPSWYALVQYEDSERNEEIVPADFVKNLKPPHFNKSSLYNVFWSPDDQETLKDALQRLAEIPEFSVGAGYSGGAGYYKAHILLVAESRKEVEEALSSRRCRKPTSKAILSVAASNNAGAASSSGMSSAGDGKKRGRPSKEKCQDDSSNKRKRESSPPLFATNSELFEGSSDDGMADPSGGVVSAKLYNELLSKYNKSKRLGKQYQDRIDRLHHQMESVTDLNIKLQERLLTCTCSASQVQPLTTSTPRAGVAGSRDPIILVEVPPAEEVAILPAMAPGDVLVHDISGIMPLDDPAVESTSTEPQNVDRDPAEQDRNVPVPAPVNVTQQVVRGGDQEAAEVLPARVADAGEMNATINADANEDMANVTVNGTEIEMMEVRPSVMMPKSVWDGPFKTLALAPLAGYDFGSKGDKKFLQDAAMAMWGYETLSTHSVTGKVSNANIKDGTAPAPRPSLENWKVLAVQAALKLRVLTERSSPLPPGVLQPDGKSLEERILLKTVRFGIGQRINSIQKRLKRTKAPGH